MKLFEKLFRPRPPIRDREELADFINAQSAFIVQKGIYEYSRARAGHYAKVLFAEEGFAQSVEHARWQAFPLGLRWWVKWSMGCWRLTLPGYRAGKFSIS